MKKTKPMTASEMGKKGGSVRAAKLTPQQRSEIARKGATARWEKEKKSKA